MLPVSLLTHPSARFPAARPLVRPLVRPLGYPLDREFIYELAHLPVDPFMRLFISRPGPSFHLPTRPCAIPVELAVVVHLTVIVNNVILSLQSMTLRVLT